MDLRTVWNNDPIELIPQNVARRTGFVLPGSRLVDQYHDRRFPDQAFPRFRTMIYRGA